MLAKFLINTGTGRTKWGRHHYDSSGKWYSVHRSNRYAEVVRGMYTRKFKLKFMSKYRHGI
mgnify:CR=1 FL=1